MQSSSVDTSYSRSKIHPQKFALYISFGSILMMFAGFTSAYVVKQSGGNWLEFELPTLFYYNALVVVASSITLHLGFRAFMSNAVTRYRLMVILTFILGLTFVFIQYQAWMEMMKVLEIYLQTNASGGFIYVITGVHVAHVLGGISALSVLMTYALTQKHRTTPTRKLRYELIAHYWHFVGFLWLYLLAFFTLVG